MPCIFLADRTSLRPAVSISAHVVRKPHVVLQIVPLPFTFLLIFQTDEKSLTRIYPTHSKEKSDLGK